MEYRVFKPHPALRSIIDEYHYIGFMAAEAQSSRGIFYPVSKRFIAFYLGDPIMAKTYNHPYYREKSGAYVIGPQLKPVSQIFQSRFRLFGVMLNTGGLYRLSGIPQIELAEKHYTGQEVFGNGIVHLTERLRNMDNADEMARAADEYFLKQNFKAMPESSLDLVVKQLSTGQFLCNTVDQLASKACMSRRQLERVCTNRLGMSPKLHLRILRFSKAISLKEQMPNQSWTQLAMASGYYDQNHFIKDFKEFSDLTPTFTEKEAHNTLTFHRYFE